MPTNAKRPYQHHEPRPTFSLRFFPVALTLIELLVVISIVVLLVAILLPCLQRVRREGQAVSCRSNLRQWGVVFAMIREERDGKLFERSDARQVLGIEDAGIVWLPFDACHYWWLFARDYSKAAWTGCFYARPARVAPAKSPWRGKIGESTHSHHGLLKSTHHLTRT